MKNNKQNTRKVARRTKEEKRRLAFEKRNVKKEKNLVRYGAEGGSDLVMARTADFNRRFIASFLALVFVLTTIIVGYNFASKADDDPFNMQTKTENGITIAKGLKNNGNGTYDIKLEAYTTAQTSTQTMDSDTPLDIVMVLDQSGSMGTEDVHKDYLPLDASSYTIDEAEGMYYKDPDDNQWYQIQVKRAPVYVDAGNGPWTVGSAKGKYIKVGDNYYLVKAGTGDLWYLDETNIDSRNPWRYKIYGNFSDHYDPALTTTNAYGFASDKNSYYYDDNGMHLVYYNTRTVTLSFSPSFYTTLYIFPNSETGSPPKTQSAWQAALTNGTVKRIGYDEDWQYTWGYADTNKSYYYGQLYLKTTSENHLYYNDGNNHTFGNTVNLASETAYSDTLYNQVNGYQLYYQKGNDIISVGDAVVNRTDVALPINPPLYYDHKISRQEAQKEAASSFAQEIAERAASTGKDHRIAIVGYDNNGSILTGDGVAKDALVPVIDTENDSNENGVNDSIDNVISGLGANGSSNLAAGLNSATSVYDANEIDINERKRVVIVFKGDEALDTNAQNSALESSAKLKDTYSASVYTLGLYNNSPSAAESNFMSRLSSDWFATDPNPIQNTDGKTYYYTATNVDSLNSIFTTAAQTTQTPATTLFWTANTVLKDVISDNFILPANPENHVTIQAVKGVYNSSGTPTFTDITNNPSGVTATWGTEEDGDSKTLYVTGFDFSTKYIAQGKNDGQKLVVTIKDVILKKGITTKDLDENGFMKFPSNTTDSGLYKKAEFTKAVSAFPMPYALVDPDATEKNGMVLSKKISLNNQNSYDLTLQAYSTGQSFNQQIPTDYVLVVDQSGSMTTRDIPTGYSSTGITKNWKVSDGGASQAYYYKETDENGVAHYYRVYQKRGDLFEYHPKDTKYVGNMVNNIGWFQRETVQDLGAASEYYYNPSLDNSGMREGSANDNHFYPVRISSQGSLFEYWIRFRFEDVNGSSHYLHYPNQPYYRTPTGGFYGPGDWWGPVPYSIANPAAKALTGNNSERYTLGSFAGITTGMFVRQVLFTRHADYSQLAYKDDNGVEHLLIDATYCNSNGKPLGGACGENGVPSEGHTSTNEAYWHGELYTANENITRLEALKRALTEFTDTVSNQGVDHRVAIAGFADAGAANTELLTGTNLNTSASNKTGIRYANITNEQYSQALLDVSNADQLAKLKNAIAALDANGGTEGQYGINMAKNILDNRAVTTFTPEGGGNPVDRLKIIVYFTDGTPGNYSDDNQYSYGNEVITAASKIKQSPTLMDTEIYSIGTFGFSDANPLVYAKYEGGANEEYKYDPDYVQTIDGGFWSNSYMYRLWLRNTSGYGDVATDTVADYMRTVTSEYPNASKFVDATWYGNGTKSDNGVYTSMVDRVRGTSTGEKYYFLCTDLTGLNRVFKTVASQAAMSSVNLDKNTIFRDTIDGTKYDYSNATVTAVTQIIDVDGVGHGAGAGTPIIHTWENGRQISDTGVVQVTNIDYTGNYPTADHNGEKLVVTISGIVPKHGAVGDEIHSNTDDSGIYTPADVTEGLPERQIAPFAKPYITRHSYTTDVGNYNPDATVKVTTKIVNEDGSDVSAGDSALDKVVLIAPNGARTLYSGPQTFDGIGNTLPSFYYENIPEGYKVQTSVVTSDTEYTYYLHYDDEDISQRRTLRVGEGENKNFTFANHQLHITSVAKTKKVTLKETVTGDYARTDDTFTPVVYLLPPEGTNAPNSKVYGDYEWTIDGENNRLTTTLDAIMGDNKQSIELEVPTGWELVISNAENARYDTISFTVDDDEPVSGTSYTHSVLENAGETTIVITNQARNITVEGILNANGHNWIIYILAALGGLAVIGAGIFLWKKRNEFVEE